MKQFLVYFSSRIVSPLVCIFTLIVVFIPNSGMAAPSHLAQYNKIHAIGNVLDSVERRLVRILLQNDGETPAPEGMEGNLVAMANLLIVQEKKLTKVLDIISETRMPNTNVLGEILQNVAHQAVRIAGHAQVGGSIGTGKWPNPRLNKYFPSHFPTSSLSRQING